MNKLGKLVFWLVSPLLLVLLAAPVFLAHVAAHRLIDRMRRKERRGATTLKMAIAAAS